MANSLSVARIMTRAEHAMPCKVDKATKILTLDKAKSQGTRDRIGKQETHTI